MSRHLHTFGFCTIPACGGGYFWVNKNMYAAKISVPLSQDNNNQSLAHAFELLLKAWRGNGQILGRENPLFFNQSEIIATALIPEENSLDDEFNSQLTTEWFEKLGEVSNNNLNVKIVGISPLSTEICECENPSSYILYTNHQSLTSPVRCGDCSRPVPLYKVAPEENGDRAYIINWQTNYQSCDALHVNSAVGEQFSHRQVTQHNSPLTKEGLEICKKIEEHTGVPTYYYLAKHTAKSIRQEKKRTCPSCSSKWRLKEPWHDMFDFKCDDCRLISNIAWSVRK